MTKEFEAGLFFKDDLSYNQKEYKLQCHITKRHEEYFPHVIMTHIPNRPSNATDGFFKKQMGVRKGVSDIAIWWAYEYPRWALKWLDKMIKFLGFGFALMHSGLVELKVDSRVQSAQNKFMSAIRYLGGKEGVAHSWQEYYNLLCSWGITPVQPCRVFDEPDYSSKSDKLQAAYEWQAP